MKVTRTIQINDLTPGEVADLFSEFNGYGQAQFFARIWEIAKDWPGAGWCQQSYDIAKEAADFPGAREAIRTLASHLSDEDFAWLTAARTGAHHEA